MSNETYTPIHNDIRYDVKIQYHREKSYILYEMIIKDLGFGNEEIIFFRFSEIKKFHDTLLKSLKIDKQRFPDFPKTHSFGFWNRTNSDPRKIEERKRQLQFYFTKLFNEPYLRRLKEIKTLIKYGMKQRRRTRSLDIVKELSYEQKSFRTHSFQKKNMRIFPRSVPEGILLNS